MAPVSVAFPKPCDLRPPAAVSSPPRAALTRTRLPLTQTNVLRYIISKNVGLAWLFNVSYSLALVAVSAGSVLWISPAAAGSGVPEVMAYLNGCHIPKARAQLAATFWAATPIAC